MQKMPHVDVRILDHDFTQAADVDHKLVELARRFGAKIVTNDFNLNKVATVQGLAVLNVNQLANALKPVVLPGEPMRVLILREGKEPNQGVAYLDDGTMVVVDGARRFINKSVDILVTSVHQTTAGKMIFGRLEDRAEQPSSILANPLPPPLAEARLPAAPARIFRHAWNTGSRLQESPQFERGQVPSSLTPTPIKVRASTKAKPEQPKQNFHNSSAELVPSFYARAYSASFSAFVHSPGTPA